MPHSDNESSSINLNTSLLRNSSLTQNIESISFQLRTLELKGLTKLSDDSRVVLCLHGWLDNAASFLPLLSCIDNHNIIAIDFPGHGHSDHRSKDAHYHFYDYIYDLLELCEVNQWESIDIVGHSMGGMIASAFTAAFPEKVRSLVLIDSLGFIYSDETQTTQQLRSAMDTRLKTNQVLDRNNIRTFSKNAAIKARLGVSDLKEKDASLLIERSLLKIEGELNVEQDQGFYWRSDSRLRTLSPYRLTLGQAEQLIKDIQCPVKLIYANKGLKMIQEYLPLAKGLINNFSTEMLIGGHHIHMEQPDEVAKIIKVFLSDT